MIPPGLKDKIPPHNEEAESATLGAMLIDGEAVSTVLQFLREDDFYKGSHQKIFHGIIELYKKGESADLITLTEELRQQGSLAECGGAAAVSGLTSAVPTSANVEYYARMVQDSALRRNLIRASSHLISAAHDDTREVRQIIEEAEKRIFELTEKQQKGSYRSVKEIVPQTLKDIETLFKTKEAYTGIPTGFPDLDSMTSGFQKAEFIVIGARPSVGKTAFALTAASNMAIQYKIPVGFFTLEMTAKAIMQRLLASEARVRSDKLRTGLLNPSEIISITDAASRIYEAPLYIDDTPSMKLLDLRSTARRMRSQPENPVRCIFIDYLTLITSESREIARHEQIAEISRSLKALARELDIPVIALSQVRRETEGKRPSLADLRESGSIEQDADVVLFLHRERSLEKEEPGASPMVETELILAKQRNGPVGTAKIAFIPQYTKFEQLDFSHRPS